MASAGWLPLRAAWESALYGRQGFYRRERPADHFRTAANASALLAEALAELVRRDQLTSVWDVGAGDGELLTALHRCAPELTVVGVELRPRPPALPGAIGWRPELPARGAGLVVASELLDNVPCDVVELDPEGVCRIVEVHTGNGEQRLGMAADSAALRWLQAWWPLHSPGERAEVGLLREAVWADVVGRFEGLCVAIDYGHTADDRPRRGSLSSYRDGHQTPVRLDARHDVTAAVAFDALAAAVPGDLRRQRDVLADLGVSGTRPPLEQATADPAGYLRALVRSTEAAELVADGGLGDHYWLISPTG